MATKKEVKGFLIGTAAGAAVGAITALLFAPKPGKELRKDIADGAQQAYATTAKAAGQVGEAAERIAKQVGSQTTQLAGKAKSAAADLIDTVSSWRAGKDEIAADEAEPVEARAEETAEAAAEETSDEERLSRV